MEIDEIKKQIIPILRKYGIQKAGIFGSSARGKENIGDVDLLVQIEKKISLLEFVGLKQELENQLDLSVDLVEYDAIKPALREEILREEIPVL